MMSLCIDNTSSSSFHSSCSSTSFSTQSAYLQQNKNGIQKPHKMQMQRNHHHNHKHVQEATSNYSRYTNVISTIDHNTFHSPSPNTYIKKENHSLTTSLSTSSILNNESNYSHNNTCVSLEVQEPYQQPTTSSSTCRGNQQLNSNCNQLTVCWKKVLSPQGSSSFKEKKMQSYLEMAKVRKHRVISEKEMIQVLHLSQQQACKLLGCSLSTLKRRFYELKDVLGLKRWPQYFHDIRHLPIFNKLYPMSLQFILNEENSSSALHSDHVIPSCDELFNNSIPNI